MYNVYLLLTIIPWRPSPGRRGAGGGELVVSKLAGGYAHCVAEVADCEVLYEDWELFHCAVVFYFVCTMVCFFGGRCAQNYTKIYSKNYKNCRDGVAFDNFLI